MTTLPTRTQAAKFVRSPRTLLYFYVAQLLFWAAWTVVCTTVPFGKELAGSVAYVTFISHLALVLTMIGAVAAQTTAVAQYEDADVQDVLDEVKKD